MPQRDRCHRCKRVREGDDLDNMEVRRKLFHALDAMNERKSDFDYDILFMHHYGLGVDVGPWHGVWGRFMKADAPVPEGSLYFDFVPHNDGKAGLPFTNTAFVNGKPRMAS